MAEQKEEKMEEKGMECCHCHQKATPRSEKERKQLQNRLSRMTGQNDITTSPQYAQNICICLAVIYVPEIFIHLNM